MSDDGVVEGLIVGYAVGRFMHWLATVVILLIVDSALVVALLALAIWYIIKVLAHKRTLKDGLAKSGRIALAAGEFFVLPTIGWIGLFVLGGWLPTLQWTQSHLWLGLGGALAAGIGGFVLLVFSFYGAHGTIRALWDFARGRGPEQTEQPALPSA